MLLRVTIPETIPLTLPSDHKFFPPKDFTKRSDSLWRKEHEATDLRNSVLSRRIRTSLANPFQHRLNINTIGNHESQIPGSDNKHQAGTVAISGYSILLPYWSQTTLSSLRKPPPS